MSEFTKDELFDLIVNDVEKYNDYKKTQEELDLSELDFSNLTLENVDLSGADLSGSSFSEVHFTNVNFSDTDLTSADFSRANLVECDFSGSLLNGTEYSYAVVSYCNFTDADLAGAVFNESDLSDSDFSAAENLNAARFDDETIWPAEDQLRLRGAGKGAAGCARRGAPLPLELCRRRHGVPGRLHCHERGRHGRFALR